MEKISKDSKSISEIEQNNYLQLIENVLGLAKQAGATQAEVSASINKGFNVDVRLGEVETIEFNCDKGVGVTVYFGQQKGIASTSDLRPESIQNTVSAACDIARVMAADKYSGLADPELMAYRYPDLKLAYPWDLTIENAIEQAKQCESLGLQYDARITNSEGAGISTQQGFYAYGNSHGFIGAYPTSRHNMSCLLVAKHEQDMQRDYYYTTARDPADLLSVEKVAKMAAEKTVSRLDATKPKTAKVPVIFAADVARSLFGHFFAAISGGQLYRKSSFLVDSLGTEIFPTSMHIYEDPLIIKGNGSAPYDTEGVRTVAKDFITNGVLESYLLSSYSARRLELQTTANAGGVHNIFINGNIIPFNELLAKIGKGLLVTELIGQGVNIMTGDYSRGVVGFWVENGAIQYPIHEATIAGNLSDMFKQIVAIGDDIETRGNIQTGSVLIEQMMLAGN